MAPKRPRGEKPGSEQGGGEPLSAPSARRVGPPGDDIAFMEQVLLELSAQNEHARAETAQRAPEQAPAGPDASPSRPRTIRVERDSEFRTPEGVASARAYLPARTVAPGRSEPMDTSTVLVEDPRKLPTMRLPRRPKQSPGAADEDREARAAALALLPDDNAPTLRSAAPVTADARRPEMKRWIGWVVAAAIAGVLVVAVAARFRSPPPGPPSPDISSPAPSARASAPPRAAAPPPAPAPSSTAAPSSRDAGPSPTAPEPSARPRSGPKSDRWF